jgi:hypothetical protein
MIRAGLIVAIAVLAASCGINQQIRQNIAASDDAECRSYGAQPGTEAYFQCRMAKDQQRQQNDAALAAAILARPQPQPYYLPMPAR